MKVEEEAKESEEEETYLTLKISAELQSIGIELYEDKARVRSWRYSVYSIFCIVSSSSVTFSNLVAASAYRYTIFPTNDRIIF